MDITTANRLYELRKQHGYSQDELADMLGVSRQAVSKWERSESSPDTDNLIALARLYNVSLDELLGFEKSDDSTCSDDNLNSEENAQNNVNDDDCDMKDIHIAKSHIRFGKDNKFMKLKAVFSACAMAISLVTYLVIGFVCNLWHPGWLVFFFPFIVDATIETIIKKDANAFPIPIIVTAVYLLMGCVWNLWHPGWIIFCALPIYYVLVGTIKSFIDASKTKDMRVDFQTNDTDTTDDVIE